MFIVLFIQTKFSKITYVLSINDSETGRIAIYFGCVNTVEALVVEYIAEIIEVTNNTSTI